MVGGTVIETIVLKDRVWVNCTDTHNRDECAIYVERNENSEQIKFGDNVWWQSNKAYWTPLSGNREDVPIERIGCSGVSRPYCGRDGES